MPPLPAVLADAFTGGEEKLSKKERTSRQLLDAALRLFLQRGIDAVSIQDIAAAAGMATATVYNHFKTRDEMVQSVAYLLAEKLCRRINDSYAKVEDGAERMAIGNRRYIWLAEESPEWVMLLLQVTTLAPDLRDEIKQYPLADLRLGVQQKRFHIESEAAAMDMIVGTVTQAMRNVALGLAPRNHGSAVATMVLRGLGMAPDEAAEVARRPLPEFTNEQDPATPAPSPRRNR